jgi:hypothetical protein
MNTDRVAQMRGEPTNRSNFQARTGAHDSLLSPEVIAQMR